MTPRATAMSPDERRRAIVGVVIPLILERGGEVSTREIAQAAGIAEGTIFRVFPDKKSLMLAAAEEAINPADGQELFDAAMRDATDLRDKVVRAAGRVLERMRLTMAVMMAVRKHLVPSDEEHGHEAKARFGPPDFVMRAQDDLHRRLTRLFEPHCDELATEPEVAAVALRSLIFGASRPELGLTTAMTPDEIADLLLDGVRRRVG